MVWISQWLGSLNLKEIVIWLVDNVAGQVIVGVILTLIVYFIDKKREARQIKREVESKQKEKLEQELNKEAEHGNEKKSISTSLILELEANQTRLQTLFESYNELDKGFKSLKKIKLPNELTFEKRIYSASSDKLGLLDTENMSKLVKYYSELEPIEEEYKKLDLIHGIDFLKLNFIKTDEAFKKASGRFNYNDKTICWSRIEELLKRAKRAYDLCEELVITLKE